MLRWLWMGPLCAALLMLQAPGARAGDKGFLGIGDDKPGVFGIGDDKPGALGIGDDKKGALGIGEDDDDDYRYQRSTRTTKRAPARRRVVRRAQKSARADDVRTEKDGKKGWAGIGDDRKGVMGIGDDRPGVMGIGDDKPGVMGVGDNKPGVFGLFDDE